jgi:hypothetical protein
MRFVLFSITRSENNTVFFPSVMKSCCYTTLKTSGVVVLIPSEVVVGIQLFFVHLAVMVEFPFITIRAMNGNHFFIYGYWRNFVETSRKFVFSLEPTFEVTRLIENKWRAFVGRCIAAHPAIASLVLCISRLFDDQG